jgi:hypothetical protein
MQHYFLSNFNIVSMDYVIQGDALVTLYLHGYNIQRFVSDILLYTCVMLYLIRTIYYLLPTPF